MVEDTEDKIAEVDTEAETGTETKEKLEQIVDIRDVGPCRKHIRVTVRRATIDQQLDEKYKELVGDSWIPGFRPGKAPRQIVIRKYKKEVTDQVKSTLLLASLEQLADDFDVAPLAPPNLNLGTLNIPDQGDFSYEFEVEVRPQFDLPEYKGLKLKRPTRVFNDDDVKTEEQRLLARHGQLVPKDGAAERGDYLIVDMTSKFNGEVVGTAKEMTVRIDDTVTFRDAVAPKFAEQTVGVKANESRTVDISMTDAVAQERLRGQTVNATFDVKDIKTMRLPELTEEFLDQYGVKNVEQFREQIRIALERRLEYEQRQSARQQVLDLIGSASRWELPQDLLMRQARKSLARRVMEMKEAGISEEEISARQRLLERDVLTSTHNALKEHFVLQKIAETEKLETDQDEINLEIERIADQYGESARRVRAQMEKEDLLDTLAAQLIERKALDLVLESATYEDVPIGKEDTLSASDTQTVGGEMKDPTAAPPEEEKKEEGEAEAKES